MSLYLNVFQVFELQRKYDVNMTYWAFCIGPDNVNELLLQAAVVRQKASARLLPHISQTLFNFLQPQC